MTPRRAQARPAPDAPDVTIVAFYGPQGYDGHAVLDEDAVRALRDELNDCLFGRITREMAARWEGSC
jgi:hypothetical protein